MIYVIPLIIKTFCPLIIRCQVRVQNKINLKIKNIKGVVFNLKLKHMDFLNLFFFKLIHL